MRGTREGGWEGRPAAQEDQARKAGWDSSEQGAYESADPRILKCDCTMFSAKLGHTVSSSPPWRLVSLWSLHTAQSGGRTREDEGGAFPAP